MVIFRYFESPSFVFSLKMHDIITVFLSVVIEASPFLRGVGVMVQTGMRTDA
jgi:hypothetical protein